MAKEVNRKLSCSTPCSSIDGSPWYKTSSSVGGREIGIVMHATHGQVYGWLYGT